MSHRMDCHSSAPAAGMSPVRALRPSVVAALAVMTLAALATADPAPDDTRQIVAEEFVTARPAGKSSRPPRRAQPARPQGPTIAELGVTVWRLRPASGGDDQSRLLVQEDGSSSEWVPERVGAEQKLALGDRVRLAFETPSSGYLYVIDREEYRDGTFSDPYVIFPTRRPVATDNTVKAGRLIEVPSRDDRPNYFTVRQSRPDQVAEVLSVIVSAAPLVEMPLASGPSKLPPDLFTRWNAEWGATAEAVVPPGTPTRAWSPAEARAGAEPTRLLTQDDPPPQTIYRVQSRPGRPLLVHIRLPYGASSPRP